MVNNFMAIGPSFGSTQDMSDHPIIFGYPHSMRLSPSQLLRQARVPAFLITDLVNIRYLMGLELSAGVLLAVPRRYFLFVDARYSEAAARRGGLVIVRDLRELPEAMGEVRRCGFEAEHVTVLQRKGWQKKFPRTRFIETSGIVQSFRRRKDTEELRNLRRARSLTRELLRRFPSLLRRRVTEQQIARQLLLWALELGGDSLSFDPIVAFGTHTSSPHHRPTSRLLQKGHIVQIDVGVKVKGYCADMSDVFFTVNPTKTQEQVYRALRIAKARAAAAVKPGTSTRELDRIARNVLKKAGVEQYFTHSLGHGVGLEIHEGVSLSQKAPDQKLLRGEVITIEPGIYIPGKWGMRLEDMVFVG